jgi:dTMP kinase
VFVAFDGIDGSGKSTQARMLHEYMGGREKTILTAEPTNGKIGQLLRSYLRGEEKVDDRTIQLLFVADRSEHVREISSYTSTASVISDRYVLSTIAYGMAAGLDKKWLIELNSGFIVPDHTIIIDVDANEAMNRVERRTAKKNGKEKSGAGKTERFEKREFLERVRKAYLSLTELYPNTHVIRSEESVGDTFGKVMAAIKE